MRVPNIENAWVDQSKIEDYLLCPYHPDGAAKARFFASFGFTLAGWRVFAEALRRHAETWPVVSQVESEYGERYAVDGPLDTPDGRDPNVRTVWIVETGNNIPRLITAHPLQR